MKNIEKELITFIKKSPTAFHAVARIKEKLQLENYVQLNENEKWKLEKNGKYFVIRGDSSIISFTIPSNWRGYRIIASHSDSPCFKLKENFEIQVEKKYVKLNVEKYGGMLMAPWFDRPLSIAGRLILKKDGEYQTKLVDLEKDAVLIPNLAIHMNREANNGYQLNAQKDMLPLYSLVDSKKTVMSQVAQSAKVNENDILASDLFLYNRESGVIWGPDNEFLSAPRLDDLECVFGSLYGFLHGKKEKHLPLHCVFDNEEVGSATKQGAGATFLYDVLQRIEQSLGHDYEEYLIDLANSFMVSADNAHALHPNYVDKADPVNRPILNEGIVIKYNANQKYCTDAISAAMFKDICQKSKVPTQIFTNRSDIPGGSTLGNISNTRVAMNTVDIGLAQLAMHSSYETAGTKDIEYLIRVSEELFS